VLFGLLLVMALVLTACSPADQSALTLDGASGRPVLVLALCAEETVTSVQLSEATSKGSDYQAGRELWAIEAAAPSRLSRFVVGEVPSGFTERVALDGALPKEMVLGASVAGGLAVHHGEQFEFEELRQGTLMRYGRPTSVDPLEDAVKANCGTFLESFGVPGWTVGVAVGAFVVGAFSVIVLLVLRRPRRSSIPN
jgi:hypothetical protein